MQSKYPTISQLNHWTLGPCHSVQISLQSGSSQEWEVMLSGWVALGSPKLCNYHLWFFLSLCSPLVRVDGENTTPQIMPLNLSNFKGQIPSTAIFTLCDHIRMTQYFAGKCTNVGRILKKKKKSIIADIAYKRTLWKKKKTLKMLCSHQQRYTFPA